MVKLWFLSRFGELGICRKIGALDGLGWVSFWNPNFMLRNWEFRVLFVEVKIWLMRRERVMVVV